MDIKKPSRIDLQKYFVKKAIPTQDNFTALMDGMLNQQDDGIKKIPKYPLAIQAVADGDRPNELLDLYKQFGDGSADWTIGLRTNTGTGIGAGKSHLNIADSAGKTAFFIAQGTCNIGLGTNTPTHALHVVGAVYIEGALQLAAPDWKPITSQHAQWLIDAVAQAPATHKDARGIVRLRGVFKTGLATAGTLLNTVVAKIDTGSAPAAPVRVHVPTSAITVGNLAGVTYVAIDILANGDVKVTEAVPASRYLFLDGLCFEAATQ